MADIAEQEEPEVESISPAVSFPDHYLIPYIERCKNSRRITCGCSLMFIGLAIFCFFATNYMINYPVTKARKIAFVFAAVFCLIAAASCLELRFRILNQCRDEPDGNTVFEMARRDDNDFSDSFSGHFEMQEGPFCHSTPVESPSQAETPDDSYRVAHSFVDEYNSARISTSRYDGAGHLPRHSISDGLSPDMPLLSPRRPLEPQSSSGIQNGMDSKRLQIGGTIPGCISMYHHNYSTFENGSVALETRPLLAKSTFDNGGEVSETEPLMAKSISDNGCYGSVAPETRLLLAEPTFDNDCEVSETEPLLAESSFDNGCDSSSVAPKTRFLLANSTFDNGCEVFETGPLLAESLFDNGCDGSVAPETRLLLAESTFQNGCDISESGPLLAESTFKNDCDKSETEKLFSEKF